MILAVFAARIDIGREHLHEFSIEFPANDGFGQIGVLGFMQNHYGHHNEPSFLSAHRGDYNRAAKALTRVSTAKSLTLFNGHQLVNGTP